MRMNEDSNIPWLGRGRARFLAYHCVPMDVEFIKALNPTVFVGSLKHSNICDPWSGEASLALVEEGIDQDTLTAIDELQKAGIRVMTYAASHQIDSNLFAPEEVQKLAARDENGAIKHAFETKDFKTISTTSNGATCSLAARPR